MSTLPTVWVCKWNYEYIIVTNRNSSLHIAHINVSIIFTFLVVVLVLVTIGIGHMFQKFHSMNQFRYINTFLDRNLHSSRRSGSVSIHPNEATSFLADSYLTFFLTRNYEMFPVCQIKLLHKWLQRFSTTIFSGSSFSEPMEKWASEFLLSQLINKWIREFFFPAKEFSIDQTICG